MIHLEITKTGCLNRFQPVRRIRANAVRRIICRVDSPTGNPPQLRPTGDDEGMWRFAIAKPPYDFQPCEPNITLY